MVEIFQQRYSWLSESNHSDPVSGLLGEELKAWEWIQILNLAGEVRLQHSYV